jgi:hypothetical protein
MKPARALLACTMAMLLMTLTGVAAEKITFTPKDKKTFPAKPAACEIAVVAEGKPDRPFTEIGVLNLHDERHRTKGSGLTLASVMPALKAATCKAGGDALIDVHVTDARRLEWAMFNVRAVVVRYEAP